MNSERTEAAALPDSWWASLTERASALRDQYQEADPFPHVVLDGFLPLEVAESAARGLEESRSSTRWHHFASREERKRATLPGRAMEGQPQAARVVLEAMNDPRMVEALSILSSTEDLEADPTFLGGGVHRIDPGGFLGIHADFNRHPSTRKFRRLNLLVYLNRDWEEDWGGDLELWDLPMERPVVRVAPVLNRAVLFSTTSTSWHGHPDPLRCPQGRSRLSVAAYYYSPHPGGQRVRPHSTRFQNRPRR